MGAYRNITDPSGKSVTIWDPSMSSGAPASGNAGQNPAQGSSSTDAMGNSVVHNADGSSTTYNRLGAALSSTPATNTGTAASSNVLNPATQAVQGGGPGSNLNVGPNGQTQYTVTPNTQSYDAEQAKLASERQSAASSANLQERARLNSQAEQQRLSEISQLSQTASAPHVSTGSGQSFDETGARNAAFARAKDTAGQTALASLKALQDVVDSRGTNGSSIERDATGRTLAGAAGALGGFTRDQLMADLARVSSLADRNYQGDITQRGQDLASRQSLYALLNSAGSVY